MDKINYKLAQWVFKFLAPYLSDVIAIPMSKRPEAVAFAKAFTENKTLKECIWAAVALTPGADEFEKAEAIYEKVVVVLQFIIQNLDVNTAASLTDKLNFITIPDGDGDPSNDTGVGELVRDIMAEVARKNP